MSNCRECDYKRAFHILENNMISNEDRVWMIGFLEYEFKQVLGK